MRVIEADKDWFTFEPNCLENNKIILQEEKITIDEEEYFDNLNQQVEVGEEFYHDEMVLS